MPIRVTHGASPLLTGAGAFAGGLAGGLERRRAEQARFDLQERQEAARGGLLERQAGLMRERDVVRGQQQTALQQARFQEERDILLDKERWREDEEGRKLFEKKNQFTPQDRREYDEKWAQKRAIRSFTGATEEQKQAQYQRVDDELEEIMQRAEPIPSLEERAKAEIIPHPLDPSQSIQYSPKSERWETAEARGAKKEVVITAPTPLGYKQKIGFKAYDEEIEAHRQSMGEKVERDSTGKITLVEYGYDEAEEHWRDKHFPAPTDPHLLRSGGESQKAVPAAVPKESPAPVAQAMRDIRIPPAQQEIFRERMGQETPAEQQNMVEALREHRKRVQAAKHGADRDAAIMAAHDFVARIITGLADPRAGEAADG